MSSAKNYSAIDRALHQVAFASGGAVQRMLGELENDLYGREFARVKSEDELFVTGLPRAGTTLILDSLYATGEFESFTYRNMPFVLAPLLWEGMSRTFRKAAAKIERAHGDGMEVSFDSPEAFEEVIWLAYLRDRIVRGDRLSPLTPADLTPEFSEAIRVTVRKLLRLAERRDASRPHRYLSKNNANLSRIAAIGELFPTATILVAFREPAAQVGSLMNQHQRFLREHASDNFSRRYMEWIGHFEFGGNFKPIDFECWLGKSPLPSRPDASFWMAYWNAAYSHVIACRQDNLCFVDFDALLRGGRQALESLADITAIRARQRLLAAGAAFRAPTSNPAALGSCDPAIVKAAEETYERLRALAGA